MKQIICIITARGGSKRIPRKNIKSFLGKPIIDYSIKAALEAGCFDEVMVSTDDQEIANIAIECGATVPFMRSEATSNDFATTSDVLIEVINEYAKMGKYFTHFCCIYPTAPFVTAKRLADAAAKIVESGADSAFPVSRFSYPIMRSLKMDDRGLVSMNWPEHLNTRSQDLPPAFHDAGQFYFVKTEPFLEKKKIFTDFTIGLEVSELEVQDIDNEDDWKMAEIKYSILKEKGAL